jgi:diguanylate cyclase
MHKPPPASPAAGPVPSNPADIAREAFRRLAMRRVAPTPEAYRAVYDEVAGAVSPEPVAPDEGAARVLSGLGNKLADMPGDLSEYGYRFRRAVKERDWDSYARLLAHLVDGHLRKGGVIERMGTEAAETRVLRDMLVRTLAFALPGLLAGKPELVFEAETLADAAKNAPGETALQEVSAHLKQFCYQLEIHSGDAAEQHELLVRLFRLLLDNIAELLDEDSWMRGQVAAVQQLIAGPIDHRMLEEATRSLKDVIYRQGKLKHGLADVKLTVKNMMMTFIDRLGSVAASTSEFHARMTGYTERISRASNIAELNDVMGDVLRVTRQVEAEALASRDRMVAAQAEAQEAEQRIRTLEAELQQMSEMVREDQLTGSLNRRGLDEVFERENARAERRGSPLCVALLDVDNFKRLNDTYGHAAGDGALRHLVRVVKNTMRSIDTVARFGGEEFLIVLPDTTVEAAAQTMTRLQRELTKHFFLHGQEKLLITFSAGVALRRAGEDQATLLERADKAMYQAKHSGKNRVVVAD